MDIDLADLARAAASDDDPPSLPVPDFVPTPGFVVKTAAEDEAAALTISPLPLSKVFINVCGAPAVPPPPGWGVAGDPVPPPAALRALQSAADAGGGPDAAATAAAEPALCFPLSAGVPRATTDAKGAPATAVDVVFHDVVLAGAAGGGPVKLYTIELALDAAERALGVALSRATRLPSARFAGGAPGCHVPARAAPMVARASSQNKSGAAEAVARPRGVEEVAAAGAPSVPAPPPPPPPPCVTWLRPDGAATGPVTSARITITLPPGPSTGPLRVTATTEGRVRVARSATCLADTSLPLGLTASAATARLEEGARVLVVEAPVASVDEVVAGWAAA